MRHLCQAAFLSFVFLIGTVQPGFAQDAAVADGKIVAFEYTLTVDDQVIDSTEGKQPIEFVQGDGSIIPGLARELNGMKAGEEKTVVVAPEDGYGPVVDEAMKEVPMGVFPAGVEPQVGQVYEFQGEDGAAFPGIVSEIRENAVLMNFNHPLAGKELHFKIKIVSVE